MKTYRLGVIAGDGIGPEVTAAALRVLEALEKRFGFRTERTSFPWSGAHYLKTRERLTPEMRDLIAKHLVRLEGADQGQEQIVFHTTPESDAILERIDVVRRDAMNDALSGWAPEMHEELRNLVSQLTQDLAARPTPDRQHATAGARIR